MAVPPSSSLIDTWPWLGPAVTWRVTVAPVGLPPASSLVKCQESPDPIWNSFFELTSMRVPAGSVLVVSVGKGVSPLPGPPPLLPPPPHADSRHVAAQARAHNLLRVSCIEL